MGEIVQVDSHVKKTKERGQLKVNFEKMIEEIEGKDGEDGFYPHEGIPSIFGDQLDKLKKKLETYWPKVQKAEEIDKIVTKFTQVYKILLEIVQIDIDKPEPTEQL